MNKRGIEMGKNEMSIMEDMLKVVADYQYAVDSAPQPTMSAFAQMAGVRFGTYP